MTYGKIAFAACVASVMLLAGQAQAQVSQTDYPQYYDYIIDHDWYCLTKQGFDEVQDGVIETNAELHFERKNTYEAYRFTGYANQVLTAEGRDYHSRYAIEGFGVNDSSFGTGVTIVSAHMTSGDALPNNWTWNDADYINLHLVQEKPGYKYPYYLEGSDTSNFGVVNYECVVKDN